MPKVRLDIAVPHDAATEDVEALRAEISESTGVPVAAIEDVQLVRRALDARRRLPVPVWHLTVDAIFAGPAPSLPPSLNPRSVPDGSPRLSSPRAPEASLPVVVVGAGPAGLFAAWHLAQHGAKVILLERGKPVETRARDFGRFRGRGELDPESNLCFGEGGAGTYSDGKLTTRKHDPIVREVLERLVEVGAPPRILIDAKPHIGTNLLFGMLKRLRAELIRLGVDVRFQTRMDGLLVERGGVGAVATRSGETIATRRLLLAIGHSARDTFEMLLGAGVPIAQKAFAIGVRIEHPQDLIDSAQYHCARGDKPKSLPAADYRLTHTENDRGVYSFCMCPGGMVVPTSTEPDMLVVNGMSTARRSSPFANSGLVVQVAESDIASQGFGHHPLGGVELQRKLERAAFEHGGKTYKAPAITAHDFARKKASGRLADSHFRPGLVPGDLDAVLPRFITHGLRAGLRAFDRTIRGYASDEANLIAVETRTSSPVRIARDPETLEVPGFRGLYVAGEGPGYAGGIVSAAADGLKVAHQILRSLAT